MLFTNHQSPFSQPYMLTAPTKYLTYTYRYLYRHNNFLYPFQFLHHSRFFELLNLSKASKEANKKAVTFHATPSIRFILNNIYRVLT